MEKAIYTDNNCQATSQLRWSLALFTRATLPPPETWSDLLQEAVERDNITLLEYHFHSPNVWLFLLSTPPPVRPPEIVKSVKGRLQHLVQKSIPAAFKRNFSLTSIGDRRRGEIESYVASQYGRQPMGDNRMQARFGQYQFVFPAVDLSKPQFSSHGRYIYNLHLVLVHEEDWRQVGEDYLAASRDMFFKAARKKGHRLSRLALLTDHLHATIGCNYYESPEEVALAYMNNLAYAHGMKAVFCHRYYVGTFGEYDMGVIWRGIAVQSETHRHKVGGD